MHARFVWKLLQSLIAQWYSFFHSCSASIPEHHHTCALHEHLLNSLSYHQCFPRLWDLFRAVQALLWNVCFPHGFVCGLSLNVIQEMKRQHCLSVTDKEMRHLKTDVFWIQKDSVSLSTDFGLVLGLVFHTWYGTFCLCLFLSLLLGLLFPFRLLPSLS